MKKTFQYFLAFCLLLLIVYSLGPRVSFDEVKFLEVKLQANIDNVDSFISQKESIVKDLKPDNQARIIWADTNKVKTEYSIVYLHGFTASQEEGDPVHEKFAKRYGCNLYLSRLHDHGRLDSNCLKGLTPDLFYRSAEEALAIGKTIGEKVIVMSCSTGSTLGIMLSNTHPEIFAHIMYSPNIAIADNTAKLITWPWGEQILTLVLGGEINHVNYPDKAKPYWLENYHKDGIIALQVMLDTYMQPAYFEKINQPLFIGCYYKDDEHQDDVVSVEAMETFYNKVRTPLENKTFKKFPTASRHVISSHIFSKAIPEVEKATYEFAENILNLSPIN